MMSMDLPLSLSLGRCLADPTCLWVGSLLGLGQFQLPRRDPAGDLGRRQDIGALLQILLRRRGNLSGLRSLLILSSRSICLSRARISSIHALSRSCSSPSASRRSSSRISASLCRSSNRLSGKRCLEGNARMLSVSSTSPAPGDWIATGSSVSGSPKSRRLLEIGSA